MKYGGSIPEIASTIATDSKGRESGTAQAKSRILMGMRIPTSPRIARLVPLLILLALAAGCATTSDGPIATTSSASSDRGIRPVVKPIDGLRLNPLAARSGAVVYVEGERKGATATTTLAKSEGDTWQDMTKDIHKMVIKDDAGALVMLSEEDVAENVAITYDPPFVLLPKKVVMGEKVTGQTTMTVNYLKTGKKRDSGPCHYVVELLGMQTIDTPAGSFDAYVFKTTREIDLSLAKVNITIHTAHVVDVGIVMTRVEQKTKAIGIFSMNKTEESRKTK